MRLDSPLKPIRRILVAGPPASGLGTIEAAVELAHRLNARLRVVQVLPRHPLLERLGLAAGDPTRDVADADVVRLAHRAGLRPSTLEAVTLRGQPRRVLLDEARRWGADLVVLGRSEGGGSGVRPGTAAEHLIRQVDCPVLVIDDRSPVLPSRVLFPVDMSDFARGALLCGLDLLRQLRPEGGEIARVAFFVVPALDDLTPEQRESIDRAGRRELAEWLAEASLADDVRPAIAVGDPAPAIVARAREGADLIVMGTHGHGSVGAAREEGVGSVAGQVLAAAPCSVLVVPPAAELGVEIAEAVASETAPRFDKRLFS